jgi:hypothetical protein
MKPTPIGRFVDTPSYEELQEEIARLRSQPCPYVVGRTTLHCSLTPFTLSDAEREAIQTAMNAYGENNDDRECEMIEATLWGLLERTSAR